MKVLVLDLETTVDRFDGKIDNSPFNPKNKCVMSQYGFIGWDTVDHVQVDTYYHKECTSPASKDGLQTALDEAELIVVYNAKFDVNWMLEMGFTISCPIYCCMVAEYVLAKGQRQELSLKATAERYDVTRKKSDLIDKMFKDGTGFEEMPLDTVIEYGIADVISCGEVYLKQQDLLEAEENKSLVPVISMMNEMLEFLVEIERNGIKVDLEVLDQIKVQFTEEHKQLTDRLHDIIDEVMGDTPINLNSGADMTKVVYSREVIDRATHQQVWNIGVGANGKPLPPPTHERCGNETCRPCNYASYTTHNGPLL